MTDPDPSGPGRFALLATHVGRRPLEVAAAPAGEAAHTNGSVVFVSAGADVEGQRLEVLVQSALLGAGSLAPQLLKPLRGRPSVARRYLSLEGRRVLTELAVTMPAATAALGADDAPVTCSADQSLTLARSRTRIPEPPPWFGVLRPSRLLAATPSAGSGPSDTDLRLQLTPSEPDDQDEDDDREEAEESKILKLFEAPVTGSSALADFLKKLFGSSKPTEGNAAGGELRVGSARKSKQVGADARPLPTPIHFVDDEKPGAAVGVGGALHPEWDVFGGRYRPQWCRVLDVPLTGAGDVATGPVVRDEILKRRLARVGLGLKVLRARPDGDELDLDPLIDMTIDLRCGHSPPENVYTERRKLARNLGVLVLLDSSGSATDSDADGLTVHDHQRRAAATLTATLEELGDRVALYAFRSQSRHDVHLLRVKAFTQRFSAVERARLNGLQPFGFTRLGAGIRGAGDILTAQAGTPNRLLIVLSDGYPYDSGYEGRYAEADTQRALAELRADGVACLCLSIGSTADTDTLARVFGSAGHASAAALADLSPDMDQLFLAVLRELAAPAGRHRQPVLSRS